MLGSDLSFTFKDNNSRSFSVAVAGATQEFIYNINAYYYEVKDGFVNFYKSYVDLKSVCSFNKDRVIYIKLIEDGYDMEPQT